MGSLLIGKYKTRAGIKVQGENLKNSGPNGQLRNQPRSLKQRSLREERRPVYLPSHVAGNVFIGVVFEVEAFLR